MQSTKTRPSVTTTHSLDEYIEKLTVYCGRDEKLTRACQLVWDLPESEEELPCGLDVALILAELSVDKTTLLVTLLGDFRRLHASGTTLHIMQFLRPINLRIL